MPLDVKVGISNYEEVGMNKESEHRIMPTPYWQSLDLSVIIKDRIGDLPYVAVDDESNFLKSIQWDLVVDPGFYVGTLKINH